MLTSRPYDRRAVFSWCAYDFANSSFSALVLTFIFSTYYTQAIAPDPITGTANWSWALTISGILIGVLSPFMGALAERGGFRKVFLFGYTAIAIICTALLYTVVPGQVLKGLLLFLIANTAIEMGFVVYNSFLPDIAPPNRIGRISGYGWSFGYVGGLLAMVVALFGLIEADTPWFGFSKETGEHIRATNLLVAVWILVFSLPLFIWVKERKIATADKFEKIFSTTIKQLRTTFHDIRRFRQIVKLLLARIFYNDGLLTIFSFGGIYAAETFGFTTSEILIFGIVLNITAGLGAFALGFLDDVIGGKKTVQLTNFGFMFAVTLAVFSPNKLFFWIAGVLVGLLAGPNQAASRSLMGRFVPPSKETEFYGFYAFSGKSTAFIGAFLFGRATNLFDTQRAGVAVILLFFIVGSVLLALVDEDEGKRLSGREEAEAKS